ncbi:MAG: glycosyltransferase family 2 protein [Rhodopila sp.]|jgi:glycosyltransferase involved in cell wall biosynthesis
MIRSSTHLLLIPSYNSGPIVMHTVREARTCWDPIWVVVDGSTDGSGEKLEELAATDPGLNVLRLPRNQGKGAAILHALPIAAAAGFTHVLTMDADGQHSAALIPAFMAVSAENPAAMVLGRPVFDSSAPALRVHGRKISNWWVDLETLWGGIGDSLFGFRVYPIAPLLAVMRSTRWMRGFDFEPEAAVRLYWQGVPVVNLPAPVRYLAASEGGVSHFRYGRDNTLLTWMHVRLILEFLVRLPLLALRRMDRNRSGINPRGRKSP